MPTEDTALEPDTRPLLEWMCLRHPASPRKRVKQWFEEGRVLLDGRPVRQFHLPSADPGERLALRGEGRALAAPAFPELRHPLRLHPRLQLVHIDSELCIVDKGAGMLSVPAPDRRERAASVVLDKWLEQEGLPRPPGRVHRLDEHTSGLLCFAMNDKARESLVEQVRSHAFLREYVAFVHGRPVRDRGTWVHHLKLTEHERQYIANEGNERAQRATTHYAVEAVYELRDVPEGESPLITRLRLTLETGLKHQIRIQAAEEGMPLIGDREYHPLYKPGVQTPHFLPSARRHALHAARLGVTHPATGRKMAWDAPLPTDLRRLEELLKAEG